MFFVCKMDQKKLLQFVSQVYLNIFLYSCIQMCLVFCFYMYLYKMSVFITLFVEY